MPSDDFPRDPEVLRAAIATFMTLPLSQRSAVILKDVLDELLEDIAEHLGTSVAAVKSRLVRGRQALKAHATGDETAARAAAPSSPEHRAFIRDFRYVPYLARELEFVPDVE